MTAYPETQAPSGKQMGMSQTFGRLVWERADPNPERMICSNVWIGMTYYANLLLIRCPRSLILSELSLKGCLGSVLLGTNSVPWGILVVPTHRVHTSSLARA